MSYETSARVEAFRHLSDAVFADGVVEPWENQVLNRAAGFLGLSSGQLQAVAQELMRRFKAGELGEAGHTSVNDLILSFQISAYLHSLTPDPERALPGVKEFTRRILKYCKEERPDWIGQALGNWRWHLDEVFERDVPAGHLRELQAEAIACGVEVAPKGGLFFEPSDWVIDW